MTSSQTPANKPLSTVTNDLFCATCAYNMRGQNLFIEPNTNLQVILCPECGTYHPTQLLAATRRWHLWSDKAIMILTLLWAAAITCLSLALLFFEYIAAIATLAIASSPYSSVEDFNVTVAFLIVSPACNAMLISAATTSPTFTRRLILVSVRWALFSAAVLATIGAYIYYGPGHDDLLPKLLLCLVISHATFSLIGLIVGRPAALLLCRSFLPKSLQHHALSYWGLPPDPAPTTTPAPNTP